MSQENIDYYSVAKDLAAKGEIELAIAPLIVAIQDEPRNPKLHSLLGVLYNKMRDFDNGFKHLRLGTVYGEQLPPAEQANAWSQLGLAYYSIGKIAEATLAFEKAIQKDPLNHLSLNQLGVMYFNTKNVNAG